MLALIQGSQRLLYWSAWVHHNWMQKSLRRVAKKFDGVDILFESDSINNYNTGHPVMTTIVKLTYEVQDLHVYG